MQTERQAIQWILRILLFHIIVLRLISSSSFYTSNDFRGRYGAAFSDINRSPSVPELSVTRQAGRLSKALNIKQDKNIAESVIKSHSSNKMKRSKNVITLPKSFTVLYNNKHVTSLPVDSPTDALFDFVIDILNAEIAKKKLSQIKIPDIHEKFHKRTGHSTIKGSFVAQKGWFKSLSSLHRSQVISVLKRGSILAVTTEVRLREMVLGYDDYKAKSVGPKGRIIGVVDRNDIEVKLNVDLTGTRCKLSLANLRFKKVSNPKIHVTGLGKMGWIFSKAVTSVTDTFKGKVVPSVEKALSDNLQAVLARTSCHIDKEGPLQ